jgi:hypothetical protein
MSRSGYSDDLDPLALGRWRQAVKRAIEGKRGQAFLHEMASALDAMPVKELIAGEVVRDSAHVCAIGSVALVRGIDVSELDIHDGEEVGAALGIARALACEIAYENDECGPSRWQAPAGETPAQRWQRMRDWVAKNLRPAKALDKG